MWKSLITLLQRRYPGYAGLSGRPARSRVARGRVALAVRLCLLVVAMVCIVGVATSCKKKDSKSGQPGNQRPKPSTMPAIDPTTLGGGDEEEEAEEAEEAESTGSSAASAASASGSAAPSSADKVGSGTTATTSVGDTKPTKRPAKPASTEPVVLTPEIEAKIRAVAAARLREAVAKLPPYDRLPLTKQLLQERYRIDFDADFPYGFDPAGVLNREQVETAAFEKIDKLANEKFPPTQREALEKEALAKFPLLQIGDKVKASVGGGRFYEGVVRQIAEDFVMIGAHRVAFDEIIDPDPRSFSAVKTQELREAHVRVNFLAQRKDFVTQEASKLLPNLMQANGFYRIEGRYLRIDEIIAELIAPEVDKAQRDAQAKVEEEVKLQVHQAMEEEGQLRGENLPEIVEGLEEALIAAGVAVADDGVRPKIVLTAAALTIDGKELPFPLPMKRLEEVLGPPERRVDILVNHCAVWDRFGISVFSNGSTGEIYDLSIFLVPPTKTLRQLPTGLFPGRMVLDGVLLDRDSDPETMNRQMPQHPFEAVEKKRAWKSKRESFYLVVQQADQRIVTVQLTTREP